MSGKHKVIRVTIEEDFLIRVDENGRTDINGWTVEEVIEDWFKRHGMDMYHATRDGHRIGNSRHYINHEIIDAEKSGR